MSDPVRERLAAVRRRFHRRPEPAWREFQTTSLLVDELERIGVDELYVGRDALDPDTRMAVPDDASVAEWAERAQDAGVPEDRLDAMAGGYTGAVAVLQKGDGPTVGLRVDIDALFIDESEDVDHVPAAEGFRSEHDGVMHACGHDAHMTLGLATVEAVKESEFDGTLVAFFQPAEEVAGGGKPMARTRFAESLDYLLAVHVGLDHPTGEVVAGVVKPLAMAHVTMEFAGESAHAGKAPNAGRNAIQALGTTIQNAYAIPRHEDGMTRVNVGQVEGGTATNVIAESARAYGEVRGETTELMEYMKARLRRVVESAAEMHDCEATFDVVSESPRADSDEAVVDVVADVAANVPGVERVVRWDEFGASEDATFLMEAVQENGGKAAYVIVGTDHPTSHHTATFDVDERTLDHGVSVLTGAVRELAARRP